MTLVQQLKAKIASLHYEILYQPINLGILAEIDKLLDALEQTPVKETKREWVTLCNPDDSYINEMGTGGWKLIVVSSHDKALWYVMEREVRG